MRIELPDAPDELIDCNCSICRRYGALWSLHGAGQVRVDGHPEHTEAYVWGKKSIATFRCRTCGCVTHWEPLPGAGARMGVNMRLFDDQARSAARVRRFDGADTWAYLE